MAQPSIGGGNSLGSPVFSYGSTSSPNFTPPFTSSSMVASSSSGSSCSSSSSSSSSSCCSSSSSSSVGISSDHKRLTLGLILHYFQTAWMIDHLQLPPESLDHQGVSENVDSYCLNFVRMFYPNSISFFGELSALEERIQALRSEIGDLGLSMIPKLKNDYEMLYNVHLCLKQRLLPPEQIETFCGIFLSENENIPQDTMATAIFSQQMYDFLGGSEEYRVLLMYRHSKQRGDETGLPSRLERTHANYASLAQQLKMLEESDVYSIKFQEIEKLEDSILLLQRQGDESDGDPLITEKIESEQKRLNGLREQLTLAVIAKEQIKENLSAFEKEIKILEDRHYSTPFKGDVIDCGVDDLEIQTDDHFLHATISSQECEALDLSPPGLQDH